MNVNEAPTRTIYPGLIMLALVFTSFLDCGAGAAELDTSVTMPRMELSDQMHHAARKTIEATTEEVREMLTETTRPTISVRLVDAADNAKSRL